MKYEGMRTIKSDERVSFVLNDNALFSGTGFKVLKNQKPGVFLPCVRSSYNGKVKLTYFTEGRSTLFEFAKRSSQEECRALLADVVSDIARVSENGFLSLRNIAYDLDSVYVDPRTATAELLYLPVSVSISGQTDIQAVRGAFSLCVDAIEEAQGTRSFAMALLTSGYEQGDVLRLQSMLSDDALFREKSSVSQEALEIASSRHESNEVPQSTTARREQTGEAHQAPPRHVSYSLLPVGANGTITYRLDKPRTIMGKHEGKADCVIHTSPAVSRVHCVLTIDSSGVLRVADLGSVNGTYVNNSRLAKGEERVLSSGTRLRLADVEFVVQETR